MKLDLESGVVEMAHGGGGRAMAKLVEDIFVQSFDNPLLAQRNDQACFDLPASRLAMTTDSYVIQPLFFPGGNIGSLAVHGTVNDLAMAGAKPLYLSAGFILEEGLKLSDLAKIVRSMASAAQEAGVSIVTGDTKVVEKGKGDGVFINTAGIGLIYDGVAPSGEKAQPGDAILISGSLGDHGVAVMSSRENLSFEVDIVSDSQSLADLVGDMVGVVPGIHVLRDPTRGGLAATLNEIAHQSGVGMELQETTIPVKGPVRAACEFLGLDPLNVANEGKLIAICAGGDAERLLAVMRAHPKGKDAAIIGRVVEDADRFVTMKTAFGGTRMVDWLMGEQLPRIC
jgi:hydrogenase expression/formation protein HypE